MLPRFTWLKLPLGRWPGRFWFPGHPPLGRFTCPPPPPNAGEPWNCWWFMPPPPACIPRPPALPPPPRPPPPMPRPCISPVGSNADATASQKMCFMVLSPPNGAVLLLVRLLRELHLDVGHWVAVDLAVLRLPQQRVLVDELIHVQPGGLAAVGQNPLDVARPPVALAGPGALAVAARRVERPRTQRLVDRVPADALVGRRLHAGLADRVVHDEECLVRPPAAGDLG